jgi:serine phosphatase RsbU (regulator of sigma subunit)
MRNKILIVLSLVLGCSFSISLLAQSNSLDSLWNLHKKAKTDSVKATILFDIGDYYQQTSPDTSLYFYNQAMDLVSKLKISPNSFALRKAIALRDIGINLRKESKFDKAIVYQLESIKLFEDLGEKTKVSQCYQNLGNVYFGIGSFDLALESYFNALKSFELQDDSVGVADCYNNIGSVHKELGSIDIAVDYHIKSMELFIKLINNPDTTNKNHIIKGLSYSYNNLGVAYWILESYDEAIDYYQKSLELKKLTGDLNGMAQCYNNIAIVYSSQGIYEKGVEFFEESLKVYSQKNNLNGLAMVNGNIAYLNILLAESASGEVARHNYLQKALKFGHKAYDISLEIGALPMQIEAANYLKDAYTRMGNDKRALEYADIFISIQKEIFSKEKANALAETATRYETEKRQLQIENMEKEKEIYTKTIFEQRVIIIFSLVILAVLLLFTIILMKFFQQKRHANILLAERNEEILQQKEEISSQLDELEDQRDKLESSNKEIEKLYHVAVEQKDILEKQKNKIDDSIRYANFIQTAVLPDLDITLVNSHLGTNSYFIMFRPKDIVSGDFYWATRINDWLILTVADCTGHGVPGAFMSMLGISFLNEIVLTGDVIKPSKILSKLRSYIIGALKQKDEWGSQRDGMDMSVISLNTKTKQCLWAGANSPLWIVRTNQVRKEKDYVPQVEEIKPNPIPVAVHIFMREFTDHDIQLQSGDRLYMFSDGYSDQFGGPDGKKYNMHKAFRKLIAQTSILPIKEQGKSLEATFDMWKNQGETKYEQIDDVTLLGLVV